MSKSLNTRKIVSHNSSWITTSDSSGNEGLVEEEGNRRTRKSISRNKLGYSKISKRKKQLESEVINTIVKRKYYVDGESWDEFDAKISSSEGVPVPVEVLHKTRQPEISQWETDETDSSTSSSTSTSTDEDAAAGDKEEKKDDETPKAKTAEPLKSCLKKGEGDQANSPEIEDLLDPMKFGYVSLTDKVLKDDYYRTRLRKKRRNIRLTDEHGTCLKSSYRSELREGGDVDVPPPSLLLQETEEDTLGIQTVQDILDSKDLTISQKYKSLGVFEDPWEEDCAEASRSGCWQWFLYKLQKIYYSQWPSVQHQI